MSDSISDQIIELRTRRGWSQHDLAERIGVKQSTVSRWERDLSSPVGLYLASLNRLLNKSPKKG